jgi:SAM-dependent methyltransferase
MSQIKWNSRGYKAFDADKAAEYAEIANEVFAPIYPVIAKQIMERCGTASGTCIELGAGPANLSIALSRLSGLRFFATDLSQHILRHAIRNIEAEGLGARVTTVTADVHRLPFADGTADLVVSRGSMRFWRNRPAAFKEIRRVLKPGGKGYVGGGLGSSLLIDQIGREMAKRRADWQKPAGQKPRRPSIDWKVIMEKAGFDTYDIIRDDSGSWISFRK